MTKCDHVNIENMKKAVQALDRAIDADIDEQVVQALESEDVIDIGVIVDKNGNPALVMACRLMSTPVRMMLLWSLRR